MRPRLILLPLVVALVSACQTGGITRVSADRADEELIRYGGSLENLDAAALEREYRTLLAQHAAAPSHLSSVKLALLLGSPSTSFTDVNSALRLLNGVVQEGGAGADFARLAYRMMSERNCVAANDGALAELLVSERRRVEELEAKLESAQAALGAERTLRETLQGQLDALKALEERLNVDGLGQGEPAAHE